MRRCGSSTTVRRPSPALFVAVTPGLRPEPQPVRVLHNGRFSLPAGRYRVVIDWASRDPLPARAGAQQSACRWDASAAARRPGRHSDAERRVVARRPSGCRWMPASSACAGRATSNARSPSMRFEAVGRRRSRRPHRRPRRCCRRPPTARRSCSSMTSDVSGDHWFLDDRRSGRRASRSRAPAAARPASRCRVHSGKRAESPAGLDARLESRGRSAGRDRRRRRWCRRQLPAVVILLDLTTTTGFVPMEVDPADARSTLSRRVDRRPAVPAKETP